MYNTASEVVREGLRLLEEQDQLRELRRTELREIMKGVEQIRNGQYTTLETPEAYERWRSLSKPKGASGSLKKRAVNNNGTLKTSRFTAIAAESQQKTAIAVNCCNIVLTLLQQ